MKKVIKKIPSKTEIEPTRLTKKAIAIKADVNYETGVGIKNSSIPEIANETEFKAAMAEVNELMNKGEGKLTQKETKKLRLLSLAVRNFDRTSYSIQRPKTLGTVLELQKIQRGWKQKKLADTLGVSESKLSMIISGKQKPDVVILKLIHEKLGIDGNFILEVV